MTNTASQPTTRPHALHLVLLAGLAALLFFTNLGGYDLWPPDEPRYAEVAREMRDSGDYLTPRVNNEPYREKPPLLFWCMAAASAPFDDVTEWPARIPSATAGIAAMLLTYLLARRLFNQRTAFWAALIFITLQRTWWQARFGQIDMLLCACLLLSLYAFWRWHDERRHRWLGLFYAACTAAIYAKGPGVLVFPTLLVIVFYWSQIWEMIRTRTLRNHEGFGKTHLILGMMVVCALFACWVVPARLAAGNAPDAGVSDTVAAAMPSAGETMAYGLFRQTIGRFFLGVSHANPPWYYFQTLPIDLLPWTLFAPWTLLWTWRNRRAGAAMRLLLSWILPAFIFFSIAIGKREVYLFPLFPALAILIAASVLELADKAVSTWRRRTAYVWAALLALLAVAPHALLFTDYRDLWTPWLLLISGAAAVGMALAVLEARRNDGRRIHAHIAAGFAVLSLLIATIVFPIVNMYKSARAFCAPVCTLAEEKQDFRLFTIGFAREEYIYYSKHFFEERGTTLLDLQSTWGVPIYKQARIQKDLRSHVTKAVGKVEIADVAKVSEAECAALRAAADETIEKEKIDPKISQEFEQKLSEFADALFQEFNAGGPAYMYLLEEDWRWVLPLYLPAREANVVHTRQVGRRHVIMLANPAGATLLGK